MKNVGFALGVVIFVLAMLGVMAFPGTICADDVNKTNNSGYWTNSYGLSLEELGAGATPLTGTMSIAEYRAVQAVVQNSLVPTDINLSAIVLNELLSNAANN